jgi:hypothetical protein
VRRACRGDRTVRHGIPVTTVARTAFRDDRTNTDALQLAGYLVLRFTCADVTYRPSLVADQVTRALERYPRS